MGSEGGEDTAEPHTDELHTDQLPTEELVREELVREELVREAPEEALVREAPEEALVREAPDHDARDRDVPDHEDGVHAAPELVAPKDPAPVDMPSADTPWKMLHAASLAVNLLPRTWGVLRGAWPLVLVLVVGGTTSAEGFIDLALLLMFFMAAASDTLVHFLTLRYRVHEGRLEILSGLLNRQTRVISPRKVQNVEMVRNVFHRASGLVEVRIETASGTEVEGTLSALTVDEAQALVDALSEARGKVSSGTPDEAQSLVENGLVDLIWFGATTTRIGAALLVVTLGFEAMGTADPELAARTSMRLGVFGGSVLVITALLGAWLVGIVNAVVRHHGFCLRRVEDSLVAEEGLFTRRKVELPVRKVQMVTVVEPWFRRWLGFGSVIVETAAARAGSGGVERALSMVPMSRPEVRPDLLKAALPGLDVDLERVELDPPNRRALARSLIRGSMQGVVLAGLISWWWWPWGAVSWLLAPLFPVIQWLDWKHQGWKITDRFVVSRRGYLTRTTRIVARQKLQAVDVDAGPLLRRYRLSEVVLRVAGAAVAMPLLDEDRAFAIAARLSETASRARRPAVTVTPEVATRLEAAATSDAG